MSCPAIADVEHADACRMVPSVHVRLVVLRACCFAAHVDVRAVARARHAVQAIPDVAGWLLDLSIAWSDVFSVPVLHFTVRCGGAAPRMLRPPSYWLCYPRVPKFWTHRTKIHCFCDRSVCEKAWRSRKRVAQAT